MQTQIDFNVRIKLASAKKDLNKSNLFMKFLVSNGCVKLNPRTYMELLNIASCFSRPLAESGNIVALAEKEQDHIFK